MKGLLAFSRAVDWLNEHTDEDTRFFGLKRECGIHEDI